MLDTGQQTEYVLSYTVETEAHLLLEADPERGSVLSLFVSQIGDGRANFRHPLSGRFACAEPSVGIEHARITIDRQAMGPWETFLLSPAGEISSHVMTQIDRLTAQLRLLEGGSSILRYFESGASVDPHQLATVLRILDTADLEWVGRALLARPQAIAGLSNLLPHDIWASEALPLLLRYNVEGRSAKFVRSIDESYDFLAGAGIGGYYVSAAQMFNAFARREYPPSRGLCVVATARNEGLYLLEWLAHHRAIGVEEFFIYTNDNDDGSDQLLSSLADAGVINLIRNNVGSNSSPQYKAYGHAFQILPEILDFHWAAVIDIDEFLVFDADRFKSMPQFVSHLLWQKTDAIALNWLMYPASNEIFRRSAPVAERFTMREPGINPHVKSISRPAMFIHSHCHYPIWDEFTAWKFRKADGTLHVQRHEQDGSAFAWETVDQGAWVNHYHTKSAEEFAARRTVGGGDYAVRRSLSAAPLTPSLAQYFRSWFASDQLVRDERALKCAPTMRRQLESLKTLPNVGSALETIEAQYARRIEDVFAVLRDDPRFQVEGSHERWFLDIIQKAQ